MIDIGNRIIELRQSVGLSQRQLSSLSGVSQAGLSAIETNSKSPSIGTLSLICEALKISLQDFLTAEKFEDKELSFELQQLLFEARNLPPDKVKVLISSAKAMH